MQVQAQLNRILGLSQDTGSYKRLKRAVDTIERDRNYRAYNNGSGLALATRGQQRIIENRITHQGRINAIRNAASGQSAG